MRWKTAACLLMTIALTAASCSKPQPGAVLDEALRAGRTAATFSHADEDFFHDMDGGIALTAQEVKGRNMWLVWSGGNDRFWDAMTAYTFGAFDLLKVISSHPSLGVNRDTRWNYYGLVNEPCFERAKGADATRFNLWLDVRGENCSADPFENEQKYPGVKIGARGTDIGLSNGKDNSKKLPIGSFYGYATGIAGLRLFPNPDFDAKAAAHWDAQKYYTDPNYYNDKHLVRPYRVGMSCGFCHIGPSPVHPPADPAHPQWQNLSSSVGAQYMWVDRLFITKATSEAGRKNFMYQLVHTYRPGTMDTSLVSTDSINNPRTMNAVYDFVARMGLARQIGEEQLSGGGLDNKQFQNYVQSGPLTDFFTQPDIVHTPHVLKDGADSVGLLGALNRVYLNIGLFSEEWLLHFNPVVGGKPITPIKIADAQKNSAYWQATEAGNINTALFFLKAAQPDHLLDAPGGRSFMSADAKQLEHGKDVFADTCARCHSSKAPPVPAELKLTQCNGKNYLDCFGRYWKWTQTDAFKQQMRAVVHKPDFLVGNYLSSDARIPVTLLRTNACSPLATNALGGNIWDNFSSQSYKELPSVGIITLADPFTGAAVPYVMPAGGRGYTRVPSLISVWSTAPYLLNNAVGTFTTDPSVAGRMSVFETSIEQMLWPAKREQDALLGSKAKGSIDRTNERSEVRIPDGYVPDALQPMQGVLHRLAPWLVSSGGEITLGPVPKNTPIGLLANVKLLAESDRLDDKATHARQVVDLLLKLKGDLATLPANATDDALLAKFANVGRPLLALSKCPDLVVNRGHYFGTAEFNQQQDLSADEQAFGHEPELTDTDKHALIAFLKTF